MTPDQLVSALQQAIGEKLKSVVLYGSATAGDFIPGVSGHDVLILAVPLDANELVALSKPLLRWEQAGNPMPQLFTPEEFARSADVFPIELSDMKQSRRVLYGTDPLGDMQIDMPHYRMQLESELKTRLLKLRRSFLACAGDNRRIVSLMVASVSTFLVLMRAALRLYHDTAPAEKADSLDQLAKHVAFDPSPFRAVLELKNTQDSRPLPQGRQLFAQYLASIEQVVRGVDRHLHPSQSGNQAVEGSHE